jgi:hypothetical protein
MVCKYHVIHIRALWNVLKKQEPVHKIQRDIDREYGCNTHESVTLHNLLLAATVMKM